MQKQAAVSGWNEVIQNKYYKVWIYIRAQNQDASKLTFQSIEEITGLAIDYPFLNDKKD